MKASETKLSKIIEGTNQYLVPHYQRPYTWETKEWKTLWDDLVDLCESPPDDGLPAGARQHFMGSIVTMPGHSVPEGVSKWLLIDGQQRLTTFLILLAAIRDQAKKDGTEKLGRQIHDLYLTNPYQDNLDHYKLLPTQGETTQFGDRAAFISLIDDAPGDGKARVRRAYDYFAKQLQARNAPDLDRLRQVIIGHLILVSIVLDRDDNPYLVFESLNAKGQQLTQADLIRNYFFMRIHVAKHDGVFHGQWKPMETRLGPENTTEFMRHFLMKSGTMVKKNEVYFTLKSQADELRETDVCGLLERLCVASGHYERLLFPDREPVAQLRVRLTRLNRLEATVTYPFLLAVYDDYNMSRISQSDFVDILDTLENFLLRRYVCRTIRAELNKLFPFLYNNAKNYSSLAQGVRDVLGSRSYPSDELFVEELTTSPLYGPGDRRERLRLILERLEESYGHRETVVSTALSIEHIMPQKLTPWWENHLGEDVAEVHETLLHTLGNLTLTGNNAELSNLEFPQKKIILRDSHLELNKGVADAPCWTRAQIERRAQELGARALLVWPNLGPARQASSRATGNVTGKTPSTVVIYERRFPVDTWQGVLQNTLTEMAELGADILEAMAETFPRSISRNDAGMRSPKQITQEWYYESHLNADQIHRFCKQVTQLAGLSADEWYVEVK